MNLYKNYKELKKSYIFLLLAYYRRVQSLLTKQQNDILELMLKNKEPMNATEVAILLKHNNRISINNMMNVLVRKKILDIKEKKNKFTYFYISDIGLIEYIKECENNT